MKPLKAKILRGLIWTAKAALLAIALAALLVWPWSHRRGQTVGLRKVAVESQPNQRATSHDLTVNCFKGWIIITSIHEDILVTDRNTLIGDTWFWRFEETRGQGSALRWMHNA